MLKAVAEAASKSELLPVALFELIKMGIWIWTLVSGLLFEEILERAAPNHLCPLDQEPPEEEEL